ncbi:MAG: hypothetical protein QOD99_622 [Chthoniobacter sp.]|jgi:hypothetical protein|nr:hypothetical protein [Chthoniobacter sp.]
MPDAAPAPTASPTDAQLDAAMAEADALFKDRSSAAPQSQLPTRSSQEDSWSTKPARGESFVLYTASGKPVWIYGNSQPWSPNLVLSLTGCLVFIGAAAVIAIAIVAKKETNRLAVIRLVGIILIMVIAAVLVVGGFSDRQIATVIGLLGTIAGYLAGSRQASGDVNTEGGSAPQLPKPPPAASDIS